MRRVASQQRLRRVRKAGICQKALLQTRAIVPPLAGTTRDVIEVQLDLKDYPVIVIDTAGIRERDDGEREGVRRARARAGLLS